MHTNFQVIDNSSGPDIQGPSGLSSVHLFTPGDIEKHKGGGGSGRGLGMGEREVERKNYRKKGSEIK